VLAQFIRKLRRSNWPEISAEVQTCNYTRLTSQLLPNGALPARFLGVGPACYLITFAYKVDGRTYGGGFQCAVEVQTGDKFPIRYNPNHPERNSSEPYGDWEKYYDWVFAALIIGLMIFSYFKR
jgi:hypothetical protein